MCNSLRRVRIACRADLKAQCKLLAGAVLHDKGGANILDGPRRRA